MEGIKVIDPETCPLKGEKGGLEYRRLYDSADGVVGICHQPSGFDHAEHWHASDELILGLEGCAHTRVSDEHFEMIREGQCIVPSSMVCHQTRTNMDEGFTCLYFFPDGPQDDRVYHHAGDSSQRAAGWPLCSAPLALSSDGSGSYPILDSNAWNCTMVLLHIGSFESIEILDYRFVYVMMGEVALLAPAGEENSGSPVILKEAHLGVIEPGTLGPGVMKLSLSRGTAAKIFLLKDKSRPSKVNGVSLS